MPAGKVRSQLVSRAVGSLRELVGVLTAVKGGAQITAKLPTAARTWSTRLRSHLVGSFRSSGQWGLG